MCKRPTAVRSIELPEYIVVQPDIHGEMLDKYRHPHRFELGCFIMVQSGNARISVNLTGYELSANSLVTVLPRSIIQMQDWDDDFRCDLVAFSSNFVKDLTLIRSVITQMDNIGNMPILGLSDDEWSLSGHYWRLLQMIYEHKSGNEMKTGAVGNLLLSFFYCICGMYSNRALQRDDASRMRSEELTRKFMALVLRHCESERAVRYYADKLCVTPQYLNAVIKNTKGETASSIIKRVTILVIEARLKSSTKSIQEIAGDLNFPNASFFAKFFKRETGMTPKQYRDS